MLPPPPPNRFGWPWTEIDPPLSPVRLDGSPWPRISVVTPSFNQADYLEETIRSVLGQNYPNTELIIIDGGSTDASIDIIHKYEEWISYWVSEEDDGQSHAINRGFRRSTGRWVGWQNSDDTYASKTFAAVGQADLMYPEADILYGETWLTDSDNANGKLADVHREFNLENMIPFPIIFNQSTFFKQEVFDHGFFIDSCKRHMMDYDFIWRLALAGFRFQYAGGIVGHFRQQPLSKTANQSDIGCHEFLEIYTYLYHHNRFPQFLRPRAIEGFRSQIINDWAHRRYDKLIINTHKIVEVMGWRSLSAEIVGRYCAARFLRRPTESLRSVYSRKLRKAKENNESWKT
jgi:glycosyltransferase involved in cell wall biosynthesis